MATEVAYPHIELPPDGPARLKSVPRVRVAQIVMDYLAHGWSPDEICRQYPHLNLAEVHAAMGYYYDHQSEIDAEIEAECREAQAGLQRDADSALRLRLRALKLR